MPACAYCQAEVGPEAKFCTACGKPVTARPTAVHALPPPPPPVPASTSAPKPAIGPRLWAVVFEEQNQAAKRVVIDKPVLAGRESGCDVVLKGIGISREHARFEPTPEGVRLTDLGSTNGTFVNGNRVAGPVVLREGDTAVIGDTACKIATS